MAINKINVDGVEHELAGSGGGGSNELVYELDLTRYFSESNFDYLLTETWFAEHINDNNIKNLKIKMYIYNYHGYDIRGESLVYSQINQEQKIIIIAFPKITTIYLKELLQIKLNNLYQVQSITWS